MQRGHDGSPTRPWRSWPGLAVSVLLLLGSGTTVTPSAPPRLALLIAALWEGETAMHNDLLAIYQALRQRGFTSEEILVLEGTLTRGLILTFLHQVHERLAAWQQGNVWLAVSGHGGFRGTTAVEAQSMLVLASAPLPANEHEVGWDEVWTTLQLPQSVQLTVLPDV